MDEATTQKIMEVLNNPEMMSKIAAIAGGSQPASQQSRQESPSLSALPSLLQNGGNDRNAQLLSALRPLLRDERQSKVDSIIRALTIASVMKNMNNNRQL